MDPHGPDRETDRRLRRFSALAAFGATGAVMTDLDGTAVHEHAGRMIIPHDVETGLCRIREPGAGR
jgi:hypothetical protein